MKILSTRDRDVEDAAAVLRALASRIDVDLIKHELGTLSTEITDYDILDRWHRVQELTGGLSI